MKLLLEAAVALGTILIGAFALYPNYKKDVEGRDFDNLMNVVSGISSSNNEMARIHSAALLRDYGDWASVPPILVNLLSDQSSGVRRAALDSIDWLARRKKTSTSILIALSDALDQNWDE